MCVPRRAVADVAIRLQGNWYRNLIFYWSNKLPRMKCCAWYVSQLFVRIFQSGTGKRAYFRIQNLPLNPSNNVPVRPWLTLQRLAKKRPVQIQIKNALPGALTHIRNEETLRWHYVRRLNLRSVRFPASALVCNRYYTKKGDFILEQN